MKYCINPLKVEYSRHHFLLERRTQSVMMVKKMKTFGIDELPHSFPSALYELKMPTQKVQNAYEHKVKGL